MILTVSDLGSSPRLPASRKKRFDINGSIAKMESRRQPPLKQ